MINLQIQLFGGRGSKSGLGVGGPGLGMVDFISASNIAIPLPDYGDKYPQFEDPDYTGYNLQTKDKFIKDTFSLLNYKRTEHKETGKKYLKSLGLNPDIKYTFQNDDQSLGYVVSSVDGNNIVRVIQLNLNKADTRRMEYKVKTMIHEGYHASKDGLPYKNKGLSKPTERFHEETRTEMTALFLAHKLNDYQYVPSYTHEVVSAAATYKRMDGFKNCNTIYDLGEKFYNERMKMRTDPSFNLLDKDYQKAKAKIDDNYYKKYYNRIIKNKDKYYECCKNSLFNYEYFEKKYTDRYKMGFDNMIEKITKKEKLTTGLEKQFLINCVALSMNEEGII